MRRAKTGCISPPYLSRCDGVLHHYWSMTSMSLKFILKYWEGGKWTQTVLRDIFRNQMSILTTYRENVFEFMAISGSTQYCYKYVGSSYWATTSIIKFKACI